MTTIRADPKTHASPGVTLKVDPDNMMVRAVISTNTPDRAGDMMIPAGLRNADEFLRNPVVLWAHQRSLPPIGTCERLTIEPERIIAETKFAASSPFARDVFTLYAEGVLRGWSVGFVPAKVVPIATGRGKSTGGVCYPEWDLLEYSAVPVPENPEALTLAVKKGLVKDADLRGWLVRDVLAALIA